MKFEETKSGMQFYSGTMPDIARSLQRIADSLEKKERRYLVFCKDLRNISTDDNCNNLDIVTDAQSGKSFCCSCEEAKVLMIEHVKQVAKREFDIEVTEDKETLADAYRVKWSHASAELYDEKRALFHWNILKVA